MLLTGVMVIATSAKADDVIDSPMYHTPELPIARVVRTFPDGLAKLWLEALGRPQAEYKVDAALAIAEARRRGLTGLEATVGPLRREIDRPDVHPAVRLAIARALVTLDAREAAPDLFKLLDDNAELRELIVPALARWDFKPAHAHWLDQLRHPSHRRTTVLAIQALLAVHEKNAVLALRELALSRDVSFLVRHEAARALSELQTSGSEADAERLLTDASAGRVSERLIAATLLRRHAGEAASALLLKLATDPEPAVAALAVHRLVETDSRRVVPLLEQLLASPDAKLRGLGVETLRREPGAEQVRLLGVRLADPHPDVRSQARRALRELATRAELREPVVHEAMHVLDADDWRGREQAAILLAQVGHRPAARRLLELLAADRPEVYITAAWGLRQLADPETLPAVLEYFNRTLFGAGHLTVLAADPQLCQLAQLFGQATFEPADAALRRLIPPKSAGFETRAAAIWALGRIHAGQPDSQIAAACEGRIRAVVPGDLEDIRVRRMSAVALGLMKAKDSLRTLRSSDKPSPPTLDVVQNACVWAVSQITGEPIPAGTVEFKQLNWFLVPSK
jgi:HEAT repeat protein